MSGINNSQQKVESFLSILRTLRDPYLKSDWFSRFPMIAHSFSSKGFDINSMQSNFQLLCNFTANEIDCFLFSLFDFHCNCLNGIDMFSNEHFITKEIIWDSGMYEIRSMFESGEENKVSSIAKQWGEEYYVETAKKAPIKEHDILISLDKDDHTFSDQLKNAKLLFDSCEKKFKREYLIKFPPYLNGRKHEFEIEDLKSALKEYIDDITILGVTQKEIGPTWIREIQSIYHLRSMLNSLSPKKYIPIHVLGCLDPKSIIYLSLVGADIFDGLSWQRYFFCEREAFYGKEFEFRLPAIKLLSVDNQKLSMELALSNVKVLKGLQNQLSLALLRQEYSKFSEEINNLRLYLDTE